MCTFWDSLWRTPWLSEDSQRWKPNSTGEAPLDSLVSFSFCSWAHVARLTGLYLGFPNPRFIRKSQSPSKHRLYIEKEEEEEEREREGRRARWIMVWASLSSS